MFFFPHAKGVGFSDFSENASFFFVEYTVYNIYVYINVLFFFQEDFLFVKRWSFSFLACSGTTPT